MKGFDVHTVSNMHTRFDAVDEVTESCGGCRPWLHFIDSLHSARSPAVADKIIFGAPEEPGC